MPKVIVVFPCPVGILISSFRFQLDWYASSSFEVLYITMFMESWCSSSIVFKLQVGALLDNQAIQYSSICSSAMAILLFIVSDGTMCPPLQLDHMHLPVLLCMVDPKKFEANHVNLQFIDAGDSKYSFKQLELHTDLKKYSQKQIENLNFQLGVDQIIESITMRYIGLAITEVGICPGCTLWNQAYLVYRICIFD